MDHKILSHKIQLHPRASLLRGMLFEHNNSDSDFSAIIPHYITDNTPVVQFDSSSGEPTNIQNYGVKIECNFRESDPTAQPITTRYFSDNALVQLTFGNRNKHATKIACHVLHEASNCFSKLIEAQEELYLAGLFILKTDRGLLVPLGLFSLDGNVIWINQEAVDLGLLIAPLSNVQIEQNNKTEKHWYDSLYESLSHLFQGDELHNKVIEARVGALLESGQVKTQKAALNLATQEAQSLMAQTANMTHSILEKDSKTRAKCCRNKLTKTDAHNTSAKVANEINELSPPKAFSIKKIRGD